MNEQAKSVEAVEVEAVDTVEKAKRRRSLDEQVESANRKVGDNNAFIVSLLAIGLLISLAMNYYLYNKLTSSFWWILFR